MTEENSDVSTDLRGAAQLTTEAIVGITNMVESLHATIAGKSGLRASPDQVRLQGIPGFVYRNIRGVTKLTGGGIDLLLGQSRRLRDQEMSTPGRETGLAILNGTFGDYLAAKHNPLAIPMQFRRNGRPVPDEKLAGLIAASGGRILILIHGSCMGDRHWQRRGHDHGAALAGDLGLTPLYVNYNSGLHISENGILLANLLEKLNAYAPLPLVLSIVGYSMGGLVARSACYYGQIAGHRWIKPLQKLVFLGTPHHGALLERGGNLVDKILGANAYSAPFSRLGKIRSSGITDMRYGNVTDRDWKGRDRFAVSGDERFPVPLPAGVDCYAIAASTAKEPHNVGDKLVGDGLVTVNSALGRHRKRELTLQFAQDRQWIGRGLNHLDLLNHPEVYETLRSWMAA